MTPPPVSDSATATVWRARASSRTTSPATSRTVSDLRCSTASSADDDAIRAQATTTDDDDLGDAGGRAGGLRWVCLLSGRLAHETGFEPWFDELLRGSMVVARVLFLEEKPDWV
ncbi:hypothetical protein CDD83_4466 [Cordyceps sp. RAO-2017]|nr:hypothetical protein CDD83_4466 [Cordyceps sp. RAO-2017]